MALISSAALRTVYIVKTEACVMDLIRPAEPARSVKVTLTGSSDYWWRIAEMVLCGR